MDKVQVQQREEKYFQVLVVKVLNNPQYDLHIHVLYCRCVLHCCHHV